MARLIRKMSDPGYYFDDLESSKGNYRFLYAGACVPLVFSRVSDIRDWLREIDY